MTPAPGSLATLQAATTVYDAPAGVVGYLVRQDRLVLVVAQVDVEPVPNGWSTRRWFMVMGTGVPPLRWVPGAGRLVEVC